VSGGKKVAAFVENFDKRKSGENAPVYRPDTSWWLAGKTDPTAGVVRCGEPHGVHQAGWLAPTGRADLADRSRGPIRQCAAASRRAERDGDVKFLRRQDGWSRIF
jgi:hypothetical protein